MPPQSRSARTRSTAVGGGISQFATTMFNAVFFAGLEDVYFAPLAEHRRGTRAAAAAANVPVAAEA